MSYRNSRLHNISPQYLNASLNSINPTLSSPEAYEESATIPSDDLSVFATAFFDFDKAGEMDKAGNDASLEHGRDGVKDDPNLDFLMGDFNFDYNQLPVLGDGFDAFQQQQEQSRPQQAAGQQLPQTPSVPSNVSPVDPKGDSSPSLEEASRMAAEEDKRRRNTAASARFRIKKKQREQALERHAKELEQKCQTLESRISQLEMENKWLKNLVVEKNTGSAAGGKEGIEGVLKGGFATTAGAGSSSTKEVKDGVGVKSE